RAATFPGAIERSGEPVRKTGVFGLGGAGHALRRHRPDAQFSKDSFQSLCMPQEIVEDRRLEIDRIVRRQRRAFVMTGDAVFLHQGTRLECLRGGGGCGSRYRSLTAAAWYGLRYQRHPYSEEDQCRRDSHCALVAAVVSGLFLSLSPSFFSAGGRGGGCGAGSLGPRCIRSRRAAMTSSFESRG